MPPRAPRTITAARRSSSGPAAIKAAEYTEGKSHWTRVAVQSGHLVSAYLSPSATAAEAEAFYTALTADLAKLGAAAKILICGDWNSDPGAAMPALVARCSLHCPGDGDGEPLTTRTTGRRCLDWAVVQGDVELTLNLRDDAYSDHLLAWKLNGWRSTPTKMLRFARTGSFRKPDQINDDEWARRIDERYGVLTTTADTTPGTNDHDDDDDANEQWRRLSMKLETALHTNTSKAAQQLISLMQAVVEAMKVSSNQSSMVLNEFERLNVNDYLCKRCSSAEGRCQQSVNQAALNAIPVILVKACDAVQYTLGGEVFSRATAAKFTPFANKAAQALACSELGLAPVKTDEAARAETNRLGNLNTGTKSFLENGEQAMDGMASTFFFAMAAEHRLDYLDYLAPGAKVALLQEFGPAGGASLTELSGEALEASMQRVVEQLRKSGSLAKAMSRAKIDSNNVRPHP